ncbi:hypothetical protein [Alicyclobacillus acidocaldarius]|nr:hypothetical protein [Alicyclobacillus acidocaldarius]
MGEYSEALNAFLEEARSLEGKVPQRAGVAYRQAALCARRLGRMDDFDHYMRLAGREFLRASELPDQPAQHIREYSLLAAQCFLAVENLDLSSKSVTRAKTVEVALEEPMSEAVATAVEEGQEGPSDARAGFGMGAVEPLDAAPQQGAIGAHDARLGADIGSLREVPTGTEENELPRGEARDHLAHGLREVETRLTGAVAFERSDGAHVGSAATGWHGRDLGTGQDASWNEPAQVPRRMEASWATEVLDEIGEIHAQMVEAERRMLELERRLHRMLRELTAEGRQ